MVKVRLDETPIALGNEDAYNQALNDIEQLLELDPKLGTKEADDIDELITLINDYEKIHHPITEDTEL